MNYIHTAILLSTTIADICARLLTLDSGIRFVGIADKNGHLVTHRYRKGITPLLTEDETSNSILGVVIRTGTRSVLEDKLGETVHAFTMYKKVKRTMIPMYDAEHNVLLVSFDVDVDHEAIILKKILPELQS